MFRRIASGAFYPPPRAAQTSPFWAHTLRCPHHMFAEGIQTPCLQAQCSFLPVSHSLEVRICPLCATAYAYILSRAPRGSPVFSSPQCKLQAQIEAALLVYVSCVCFNITCYEMFTRTFRPERHEQVL